MALDESEMTTRKATRSSLACLPCRTRHLKCNGARPRCARCVNAGESCHYAQSRRGGLDRAALAERRKRLAAADALSFAGVTDGDSPCERAWQQPDGGVLDYDFLSNSSSSNNGLLSSGLGRYRSETTPASASSPAPFESVDNDPLITTYYRTFHRFHPIVLPFRNLALLHGQGGGNVRTRLQPLIAILRLIGHLYYSPTREFSQRLRDVTDRALASADAFDPFTVQARLLFSIILFWSRFNVEARREMDAAVAAARHTGMYRLEFAAEHSRLASNSGGGGSSSSSSSRDPVLAESWRRTWWMLFIVDAYYAGTLGTLNMAVVDVDATAELPCEEAEYELGVIPEPRTLEEFDCREFSTDDAPFSSFAYLIGAVRCAASAIMSTPKAPIQEASIHVVQAADSAIDAWQLLLPKTGKDIMAKNGEIDELMFQAHLLIHVSTIGLHRPLSDLKFNAVEDVSSCAREPPMGHPTPDLVNVHTVRVLRAAEAQIRLLALANASAASHSSSTSPGRHPGLSSPSSPSASSGVPFCHTPFVTCMLSEGTLALLSGCKYLLQGRELAVARDQIRVTVGCLRQLGELWSRSARNVQEIQMIARHVLGLGVAASKTPNAGSISGGDTHCNNSSSNTGNGGGSHCCNSSTSGSIAGAANDVAMATSLSGLSGGEDGNSSGLSSVDVENIYTGESLDTVCGWYNWDLGTDYSWLLTPES